MTWDYTHRELDSLFSDLGIIEPPPPQAPAHMTYIRPSKANRVRDAIRREYDKGGSGSVLAMIQGFYAPVSWVKNPSVFKEFCDEINPTLRFSGLEYKDDGKFHSATQTDTLTDAEARVRALEGKLAHRRIHSSVQGCCRAEFLSEDYFHAVQEAAKGLAERIREKTGLTTDGTPLAEEAFGRKRGYPMLAINTLSTRTDQSEHDGIKDLLTGVFRLFRNPTAHTLRIKWRHDVDYTVDSLTTISQLHYILDDCYPTGR